jgi:ribosomal protein S18 acetylase RimI-like enzyme
MAQGSVTMSRAVGVRLRVRRATENDLGEIAGLLAALGYRFDNDSTLAGSLRDTLERPDMALFLACDPHTGRPVGLLLVSQRPQLQLGGTLVSIDTLVVNPDVRGLGVGRRLLRRARAYARLHRAVRVEVNTTRTRENYRRGFYPANGYEEADAALFRLAPLERRLAVVTKKM